MASPVLSAAASHPPSALDASSTMTVRDASSASLVLFALTAGCGVGSWMFAVDHASNAAMLAGVSGVIAFVVSLIVAFMSKPATALFFIYAICEGVALGAISQFFDQRYPGVVVSAVLATACLFGAVLLAWRANIIRVTARSARILFFAMLGYVAFAVINSILVATGILSGFGVGGSGPLGIIISVVAIALGAYSLAVDFEAIDQTARAGVPRRTAWLLGYGLLVSVIWLYIEFLRLFARLQSDD